MHRLIAIGSVLTALLGPGAASLVPNRLLPGSDARGAVTGRVTVSAETPPPPASLSPYARRRYMPPQSPGVPGGAEDAFVYLEPAGREASAGSSGSTQILQRDRTVIPHASVAQVGQLVEFPNEDDVYHNLFSLSSGNRFSLGRYAPSTTETHRFEQPGVVQLFCDIHAEMAGVILVVATPYVTRVERDGSYRVGNVPAGAYLAIAWHPVAGADTVALTIQETQEVSLDFALSGSR